MDALNNRFRNPFDEIEVSIRDIYSQLQDRSRKCDTDIMLRKFEKDLAEVHHHAKTNHHAVKELKKKHEQVRN